MPTYNKLVRDKIPAIIEDGGERYRVKVLDDKEYISELEKKAIEELKEVQEARDSEETLEELADLTEVVYAMVKAYGYTIEDLETVRKEKLEKRGGFKHRLYLIDVEEGGV